MSRIDPQVLRSTGVGLSISVGAPRSDGSNGSGSTVVFVVFRRVGLSDEEFLADWSKVQRDLESLKRVLEK